VSLTPIGLATIHVLTVNAALFRLKFCTKKSLSLKRGFLILFSHAGLRCAEFQHVFHEVKSFSCLFGIGNTVGGIVLTCLNTGGGLL
jgi:hypothetical protein